MTWQIAMVVAVLLVGVPVLTAFCIAFGNGD